MSRLDGGYEDGYRSSTCFWGQKPGTLIVRLTELAGSVRGWRVLDLGCGEGKNAAYLASLGAQVFAVDLSERAISNGRRIWGQSRGIAWAVADATALRYPIGSFDTVILYGLLHCLRSEQQAHRLLQDVINCVVPGGFVVSCAFNTRHQDMSAHPGFSPLLLDHHHLLELHRGCEIIFSSDTDLHEMHPHNGISHSHALTRVVARKLQESENP